MKGISGGNIEEISFTQLKRLQATNSIVGYYHLQLSNSNYQPSMIPWIFHLQSLIQQIAFLFQEPQILPPKGPNNHKIYILQGAGPVNVRLIDTLIFKTRNREIK